MVAPDRLLSMGQIELYCVLTQNWIAWNTAVWHINCILMQNWIVWNKTVFTFNSVLPRGWSCRILRLLLYSGVRPLHDCTGYDIKQSNGEFPVMLELWGMRSNSSLPSLQGPLWPAVIAPDRVLSIGQMELDRVLMQNWIAWNRVDLTFRVPIYAKLNCPK